jgi:hypothetical protein
VGLLALRVALALQLLQHHQVVILGGSSVFGQQPQLAFALVDGSTEALIQLCAQRPLLFFGHTSACCEFALKRALEASSLLAHLSADHFVFYLELLQLPVYVQQPQATLLDLVAVVHCQLLWLADAREGVGGQVVQVLVVSDGCGQGRRALSVPWALPTELTCQHHAVPIVREDQPCAYSVEEPDDRRRLRAMTACERRTVEWPSVLLAVRASS